MADFEFMFVAVNELQPTPDESARAIERTRKTLLAESEKPPAARSLESWERPIEASLSAPRRASQRTWIQLAVAASVVMAVNRWIGWSCKSTSNSGPTPGAGPTSARRPVPAQRSFLAYASLSVFPGHRGLLVVTHPSRFSENVAGSLCN